MTPRRAAPALLAIGLALAPGAPPAQTVPADEPEGLVRAVQAGLAHYGLLALRTAVDLSYESVTVDPRTGDTVINGLTFYPRMAWESETPCVVTVERVAVADLSGQASLESMVQISGITVPPECVEPQTAALLQGFGYPELVVTGASLRFGYDLPSAEADLEVNAAIADAGELNLTAAFDYLSLRAENLGDLEDGVAALGEGSAEAALRPVAHLRSAELSFENRGVWKRVEPFLQTQMQGELSGLPQLVSQLLLQALVRPERSPTAAETDFAADVGEEVARFLEEKNRLVLTVAPEGGVLLNAALLDDPSRLVAALEPRVSARPEARAGILPPDALSAALSGGGELDAETRLRAGEALVTGIGAPRAPAEGRALLEPLAEDWQPRAALLVARAQAEAGETPAAYAMALRAMAGEAEGATGLVDRLEARLGAEALLDAQEAALEGWPGRGAWEDRLAAAQAEGDVLALRRLAFDASVGRGMPRSYARAYFAASLAAAAGDRGAAALRGRLDARFRGADGTAHPAWAETADAAAAEALAAWTEGGLAERLSGAR
jgi:hypothetical protein